MTYKSAGFTLVKGDYKILRVTVEDTSGVAVDISSYKARFTIKKKPGATSYILRKATANVSGGGNDQVLITDPTNGILEVYIQPTDLITRASCTITTASADNILNNEGFILKNSVGTQTRFKYSKDGGAVTSADVTIAIASGQTADTVAIATNSAIDGCADFSSSVTGNVISVTQVIPGAGGNQTNTESIAFAGFLVTSFSGGSDEPVAGAYYYEVELEDPSNHPCTVLQEIFTLTEQLNDWSEI